MSGVKLTATNDASASMTFDEMYESSSITKHTGQYTHLQLHDATRSRSRDHPPSSSEPYPRTSRGYYIRMNKRDQFEFGSQELGMMRHHSSTCKTHVMSIVC